MDVTTARTRRSALAALTALVLTSTPALASPALAAAPQDGPAARTAAGTSAGAEASGGGAGDSAQASRVVRLTGAAERPRMVCPSGERAMMIADFVAGAKGDPTPEEAIGLSVLEEGEQLVISGSGAQAWIVRADGTARERIGLLRQRGWLVSERESCA